MHLVITFVSDCGGVCQIGADVSCTRRLSPRVNIRRSFRVGAWNVLSRREDNSLSLLSSELQRLNIFIAAVSEVRGPDIGDIMEAGCTDSWSGCSDGYNAQGVAAAVSNNLTPMIIEVNTGYRVYYETENS